MIRRHAASLLLLGVFVFVFFYDVWLLGRVWFDSPGIYFYFPWRMDSRYTLFDIRLVWGPREGIPFQFHLVKTLFESLSFPLWNPYLLAGEPFFATGHKQVLDLTNFIYFFADLPGGMNLQITLQIFLAGAFMYVLAHRWTRDRLAASVAAVAYAFSGHIVSKTYWAPNIGDAMWIPLGILFADLAAVSGRVRYFVLYGMVLSAIFLGGSETHVPLIFLFLLMYLAVRLLGQWRRGEWPGSPPRALWLALLSFGVFLGVSAVRLIPFAQHILLSDRSMPRPTPEWVLSGAQPYEILRLVVYTFLNLLGPVRETVIYRGDVRNSFFLGVAALFLVLPRLRRVASGRGAFFFWSALLSIPFAALSEALLLGLIQVPALSRVAYLLQSVVSTVDRVSIFYVAGVPLLCAFGVRELREDLRRGLWARWMRWGAAMAAGLLAWMILVRTPWAPALTKVNAYFFFWPSLGAAVLLAAALLLRARSWIPQRVLGGIILAVLFSELMIGARLVFSPAPREEFYPEMPSIRFLKSRPGLFRVDHMTEGPHLAHHSRILLASLLLPFEIQTITGYETVLPRRHHELFSAMATPPWAKRPVYFYNYVELTPRSLRSPLLDLFNVRYLLLSVDFPDLIPDDRYRLV
ncbi:MAG: hypothetical protein HYY21_02940, partial [Candidatus Tectomicrobia bacterium]|nr:hypothetical protein [Candidatus Tectomicrobia bacterium]